MSPEKRRQKYKAVINTISDELLAGRFSPGDKLPTERSMAIRFEVSRHTVRQAVTAMVAGGILYTRQGGGIYVSEISLQDLNTAVSKIMNRGATRISDILAFRRMLEPQIAFEAAAHITPSEIDALKQVVSAQQQGGLFENIDPDMAFHKLVATASRNPVVVEVMASIMPILAESRHADFQTYERRELSIKGHREIIRAFENGDADGAREAMVLHLNQVSDAVL